MGPVGNFQWRFPFLINWDLKTQLNLQFVRETTRHTGSTHFQSCLVLFLWRVWWAKWNKVHKEPFVFLVCSFNSPFFRLDGFSVPSPNRASQCPTELKASQQWTGVFQTLTEGHPGLPGLLGRSHWMPWGLLHRQHLSVLDKTVCVFKTWSNACKCWEIFNICAASQSLSLSQYIT